jgi:hypothetical protein
MFGEKRNHLLLQGFEPTNRPAPNFITLLAALCGLTPRVRFVPECAKRTEPLPCERGEYGDLVMPAHGRWDLTQRLKG